MKKKPNSFGVIIALVFLAAIFIISGCETAKGIGRDVKKADEYIRDHAW